MGYAGPVEGTLGGFRHVEIRIAIDIDQSDGSIVGQGTRNDSQPDGAVSAKDERRFAIRHGTRDMSGNGYRRFTYGGKVHRGRIAPIRPPTKRECIARVADLPPSPLKRSDQAMAPECIRRFLLSGRVCPGTCRRSDYGQAVAHNSLRRGLQR
ncbi:hypothetical protein GCM10010862_27440 [Devosia nitrariae]|uniref:Uncharacterized protein n=1 Tax=Devosia nitrariae TaxID=2071872 RepID=A0ABQ5W6D4_9HYPH|nr:hypothetical protein GCM10010862_27440 [Devosia nitrariae]